VVQLTDRSRKPTYDALIGKSTNSRKKFDFKFAVVCPVLRAALSQLAAIAVAIPLFRRQASASSRAGLGGFREILYRFSVRPELVEGRMEKRAPRLTLNPFMVRLFDKLTAHHERIQCHHQRMQFGYEFSGKSP
jgi:hypothetical protein